MHYFHSSKFRAGVMSDRFEEALSRILHPLSTIPRQELGLGVDLLRSMWVDFISKRKGDTDEQLLIREFVDEIRLLIDHCYENGLGDSWPRFKFQLQPLDNGAPELEEEEVQPLNKDDLGALLGVDVLLGICDPDEEDAVRNLCEMRADALPTNPKKPTIPKVYKRLMRYRSKFTTAAKSRIRLLQNNGILVHGHHHLLSTAEYSVESFEDRNFQLAFTVLLPKQTKQVVKLGMLVECTCVDSLDKQCAHVLFILIYILGVEKTDLLVLQKALLPNEIVHILNSSPRYHLKTFQSRNSQYFSYTNCVLCRAPISSAMSYSCHICSYSFHQYCYINAFGNHAIKKCLICQQ